MLRVGHGGRYGTRLCRVQRNILRENDRITAQNLQLRIGKRRGGVQRDAQLALALLHAEGNLCAGVFQRTGLLVGHEILREGFFLIRLEEGEIRLVIGKHTGHQLDVGSVFIGQIAIPRLAKVTAAPCPLLFAGGNMVIRDMQKPRLAVVVVIADKIIVRVICHIGGRHRDIFVAGNIGAGGVVVLVVYAVRNRKFGNSTLAVVHHSVYIGRENRLRGIVDRHSRVRPPQKGLRTVRGVVHLPVDFQIGAVRVEREARHTLGVEHLFGLTDPDRHRTVRTVFDFPISGVIGRGAVVLRPVELNAAGDPRPCQPYQCGLDDLVVINCVITVGFVVHTLDTPAQLRQDHHKQIVIFQIDGIIFPVNFGVGNALADRVRIDPPAGALIDTLFQKHRVFVIGGDRVGGNRDFFLTHKHLFHSEPPDGVFSACLYYTLQFW